MTERESRAYLENELKHIKQWENSQKKLWFWERLGRLPFKLLDKMTPAFIQKKIGQAIDELSYYIQSGGRYLISKNRITERFNGVQTPDDIARLPLSKMDAIAEDYGQSRAKFATFQGATTGIGGMFTLAVDIPALLGLSLKTLQEIAICYGYDPEDKSERIFIVKCLQFASSDIVGKKAIIEELSDFHSDNKEQQTASQLQGWREVVMTYRDHFGWKKLLQLVPIAGIIFGAMVNKSTLEDVAEAGRMLYKKRRILERLKRTN
ncbi:EcsC family protein [Tuberibacillus sp. Marseille-P3662]|uniref:EcsC family protein n=1 Tax=Tuberibacillus sp. Marseille-P3662 TaxID=1965358 RepID=UPI000A1CAE5C|nr:EcsC family protein [Tuberibacillus sp. Marseille-P3662]